MNPLRSRAISCALGALALAASTRPDRGARSRGVRALHDLGRDARLGIQGVVPRLHRRLDRERRMDHRRRRELRDAELLVGGRHRRDRSRGAHHRGRRSTARCDSPDTKASSTRRSPTRWCGSPPTAPRPSCSTSPGPTMEGDQIDLSDVEFVTGPVDPESIAADGEQQLEHPRARAHRRRQHRVPELRGGHRLRRPDPLPPGHRRLPRRARGRGCSDRGSSRASSPGSVVAGVGVTTAVIRKRKRGADA